MSVSGVTSTPLSAAHVSRTEAAEGPGPDHDGDSDDAGAAAVKAPQVGQQARDGVYL